MNPCWVLLLWWCLVARAEWRVGDASSSSSSAASVCAVTCGGDACFRAVAPPQLERLNGTTWQTVSGSAGGGAWRARRDACLLRFRASDVVVVGGVDSLGAPLADVWMGSLSGGGGAAWRELTPLPVAAARPVCVAVDAVAVVLDAAAELFGLLTLSSADWLAVPLPPALAAVLRANASSAALVRRQYDVAVIAASGAALVRWTFRVSTREWFEAPPLLAGTGAPPFGGAVLLAALDTAGGLALLGARGADVVAALWPDGEDALVSLPTAGASVAGELVAAAPWLARGALVAQTARGGTLLWNVSACSAPCQADAACVAGECRCASGAFATTCATVPPPTTPAATTTTTTTAAAASTNVEAPVSAPVAADDMAVQIGVSVAAAVCLLAVMVGMAVAAGCVLQRIVNNERGRARGGGRVEAASANAREGGGGGGGGGAVTDSLRTYVDTRFESSEVALHMLPLQCVPGALTIKAAREDGSEGELDVDVAGVAKVTLSCDRAMAFQFAPVASATFVLEFVPHSGMLKPHEPLDVAVRLTPRCTTVIDIRVALHVSTNAALAQENELAKKQLASGVKHALLQIEARSAQSVKLDYDLLGSLRPLSASSAAAAAASVVPADSNDGSGSARELEGGRLLLGTWNGQVVAVKMLRIQRFDDSKVKEAFEKEVVLLSKLRHRNVVSVYGSTTQPGKLAVVTEHVDGSSVAAHIDGSAGEPLSRTVRLKVMLDVAEALGFLHRCDILHRNVKPNNVLVVSRDVHAAVHAKVTDFGACRSLADRVAMAHRVGIGRPIYTAPEILCLQPYSTSSDVYSFAMFLVFLLLGAEPFAKTASHWEVVEAIVSGKRPELDELAIGDPTLVALIKACWNADVNERPDMRVVVATCKDVLGVATKLDGESLLQEQAAEFAPKRSQKTKKAKKRSAVESDASSTTTGGF